MRVQSEVGFEESVPWHIALFADDKCRAKRLTESRILLVKLPQNRTKGVRGPGFGYRGHSKMCCKVTVEDWSVAIELTHSLFKECTDFLVTYRRLRFHTVFPNRKVLAELVV